MNIRHQRGMGLVELMISIVIGMIVIAGALTVAASTMGANASQMKMSRLNNELRIAMTAIVRDMRRASFNAWPPTQTDYSVNPQAAPVVNTTVGSQSMIVTYDENANQLTQTFGYQVGTSSSTPTIQSLTGTSPSTLNNNGAIFDTSAVVIDLFTITDRSQLITTTQSGGVVNVIVPIYTISITGHLKSDPTVIRTIQETVRIRNVTLS